MSFSLLSNNTLTIWLGVVVVLMLAYRWITRNPLDPREPPLIKPTIPVVGHALGLFRYGPRYFSYLRESNSAPASTFMIASAKMYLVSSPPLSQILMKHKAVSFDTLVVEFGAGLLGIGPETEAVMRDMPKDPAVPCYMREQHKAMHLPLQPGKTLLEMNRAVLRSVAGSLNEMPEEGRRDELFTFVREVITNASDIALFGGNGVLKGNKELMQGFWDLDDNLMSLMILPYPHITAKKPYNGRAGVLKALREWHAAGGSKDPSMSPLVRLRMDVSEKYNITTDDVAHSEFGMLFVSTINAIPTCYWLLSYILRDPELLEQLQEEVTHIVTTDGNTKTIDISQFSANCPLLVSAYQETMRLSSVQTGTRFVQDDAEITYTTPEGGEKTYLFKKGAVIQMPTTIVHYDKSIWGLDASEFNARRFLKSETTATKDEAKLRRQAFYPFGGGKHLCPGRHLADAEILGMVTAIMLGFDVEPVSGRWVLPKKIVRFGDGIAKPDVQETPTKVVVTRKKGWEDVKWAYCVDTKVEE